MQAMSRSQNAIRWKPQANLREGQQRLYELIKDTEKSVYTIQLPTGYGKSWCACLAYGVLKDKGIVDRLMIVVPTDQQRSQYVTGLIDDLRILGVPYFGIERCNNSAGWVLKKSFRNESDIFVAGVQSIQSDAGYYSDLMSKGRWLVVADEFHHYGDENSWGNAIKGLNYKVILGMSATPLRADKKPTIFGNSEFDVAVSIQEAYEEGAIKRVCAQICDYNVSWSTLEDPSPQNSLMSELAKDWPSNVSEYELKKGVRYYDKYVSSIFTQVLSTWNDYESKWPEQNQILVFAMSCRHAEFLANLINSIAFPGFPEPFADWIGVGDGEYDTRTPEQNDLILKKFQNNQLTCLVQVNKAGEGFNNKRCSIGLFLDLVGDSPMKRQHIGRFMRVNPNAPNQESVIFISEDSPSRMLLENFQEEFGLLKESEDSESLQGGSGTRQLTLPDIYVIDTQYQANRLIWPYGSPDAAVDAFLSNASPKTKAAYESLTEDEARALLKIELSQWLAVEQGIRINPLTSEERRDQIAGQVKRNSGAVASLYLRKRFGASHPKNAMRDVLRLINNRAAKEIGCYQKDMDEQELRDKNEWLKELFASIQEDRIPTWLNL